ncbi:universal stress protein [Nonomuraea wenchangensis]|uniref:universal stress protein n=1 Tax=Nonomuraea wenchangensis TaxID=568860 RepID=UPI003320BAFE
MNDGQAGRPVLVGYDESAASRHALNWAVEEARLRRAPVLVCHALHWPYTTKPVSAEMMAQIEQVAQGVVDEGVRRARELAPEVDARGLLARGTPAAVLLEAGRAAELAVLGSRGQGGFDDLRVGSAAVQVPAHCVTPVVVVRPELRPPAADAGAGTRADAGTRAGGGAGAGAGAGAGGGGGAGADAVRIVVGLDGSPAGLTALEFALDEAALRLGAVTALCCWTDCGSSSWPDPLPFVDSNALRRGAEDRFREVVTRLADRRPDVPVITEFVPERPQRALLAAAEGAALLVLGNRGNESRPRLLLGPVTQSALAEAGCPVAVTPATVLRPRTPPDRA